MLRLTSVLPNPTFSFLYDKKYNDQYNSEYNSEYNSDLRKIMNEGIRRTIEYSKKKNEEIMINKYLKEQSQLPNIFSSATTCDNSNNGNNRYYIFCFLSFLAGYHFRYFIERTNNT